ncbi:DUF126 domain-containing protein [Bacillus sp. JJ1521]|uniref:aconitase X swivel domain-containing protein n=1 Tax=Bacillus sp. JJ1521 TaxID=3122957 RepID=UPI002FFFDB61
MEIIPITSAFGPPVSGEPVVLSGGFSPRYHLNRETGAFSVPDHPLDGQKITGKILVCDYARGGIAAGWALNALKEKDFAPKAIIFMHANPVMVQGAIFSNLTIAEGLKQGDFNKIYSNYWVHVDPVKKQLVIEKNE